jgi:hypothetical protein
MTDETTDSCTCECPANEPGQACGDTTICPDGPANHETLCCACFDEECALCDCCADTPD